MGFMDAALHQGYETSRRMQLPPRPHVLLRHAPPAGRGSSRHTRALRLRAHRRSDRRRPAPAGHARRPPRGAGRLGGRARGGRRVLPADRARAHRRGRPPRAPARRAAHLHALDADRLRAGADRQLGRARGLHGRLGGLGRADHGRAAGRARRAIIPTSAGSASPSSSRTSSATCARTTRLDRVYLPAEDRERFGVSEDDLAADRATPEVRALLAHEVERARALFARRRARRSPPRPPRCAPAIRFATALYGRMLDRVEAGGFDVLGRPGRRAALAPPGRGARGLR